MFQITKYLRARNFYMASSPQEVGGESNFMLRGDSQIYNSVGGESQMGGLELFPVCEGGYLQIDLVNYKNACKISKHLLHIHMNRLVSLCFHCIFNLFF